MKESIINNFNDQLLGYSEKEAINEASRCLQCKTPKCILGCPLKINIPKFISYIKKNNIIKAYEIILESNLLPSICGRVCPQEKQCEAYCILKNDNNEIHIGKLEQYVADNINIYNSFFLLKQKKNDKKDKKIAVIGSGPSGIIASLYLKLYGYDVTIYEAFNEIGGVLLYGIPNFRLPKIELNYIKKKMKLLDINIKYDYIVGNIKTIDQLSYENDAIFIGTGANSPIFLNIEEEDLNNIYSANEYLTRINLMKAYDKNYDTPIKKGNNIIVIGGGNVAVDAARCAVRVGAKNVKIIYRRGENELSARKNEIINAKREGVEFIYRLTPVSFSPNPKNKKNVGFVKFKKTIPINNQKNKNEKTNYNIDNNTNYFLKADVVIVAIGTKINDLIFKNSKIIIKNIDGTINLRNNLQYEDTNIFAGGDVVTGTATVISAMEQGKRAATSIDSYLSKK